jgi:hypothetical protein
LIFAEAEGERRRGLCKTVKTERRRDQRRGNTGTTAEPITG